MIVQVLSLFNSIKATGIRDTAPGRPTLQEVLGREATESSDPLGEGRGRIRMSRAERSVWFS
jgi:hypothetical protein